MVKAEEWGREREEGRGRLEGGERVREKKGEEQKRRE